jgi:hypothetical protein
MRRQPMPLHRLPKRLQQRLRQLRRQHRQLQPSEVLHAVGQTRLGGFFYGQPSLS